MSLDLVNNIINDIKNNKSVQNFIKELENYIDNNTLKSNDINTAKDEITLVSSIYNGNKITAKYRDKMLLERNNILNEYAQKTINKGQMFYIYSKNSKMTDGYNLCICKEDKSHTIIEADKKDLPNGVKIGSVLRRKKDKYILDERATEKISQKINSMRGQLLKEQTEFLKSKRIEGHIYEMSENDGDRVWLFDITSGSSEGIEEIEFPIELLKQSKEGDIFKYINGEYQKI